MQLPVKLEFLNDMKKVIGMTSDDYLPCDKKINTTDCKRIQDRYKKLFRVRKEVDFGSDVKIYREVGATMMKIFGSENISSKEKKIKSTRTGKIITVRQKHFDPEQIKYHKSIMNFRERKVKKRKKKIV